MRGALQLLKHQRFTIQATVGRFGEKPGWLGESVGTILWLDVHRVADGLFLTDHLWFTVGTTFDRLDLHCGDRIQFDAWVGAYHKGYQGRRAEELGDIGSDTDYPLAHPTRVSKIAARFLPAE